jgi:hypothetical protein
MSSALVPLKDGRAGVGGLDCSEQAHSEPNATKATSAAKVMFDLMRNFPYSVMAEQQCGGR